MTERARTIFLGSGSFAVPIVAALGGDPNVDLVGVVTAPPRRGSRGALTDPPVAEWASAHGVPMLRPTQLRDEDATAEVASLAPDLLVLADYGRIVPQDILDLPRHGALNLHPSLLPRHRGAAPIPAAILAGDDATGVTLMQMDAGLDSGPIVAQTVVPLDGNELAPDLERRLSLIAADLLRETLPAWLAPGIEPSPQPDEGMTMTRPLRREDGRLDPQLPASSLERKVRAFQPWPGTFFEVDGSRVVIWTASTGQGSVPPGLLVEADDGMPAIGTADGLLRLAEVQPAGGRRMSGPELLRGRPGLIGTRIDGASGADHADSR